MEYIKFESEELAQAFVNTVNEGEGIPKPDGVTQTYCDPEFIDGEWSVVKDEVTEKYIP